MLISLFQMPPDDYKRFLNFLRKHNCQLAFQPFRTVQWNGGQSEAPEKVERRGHRVQPLSA